jgi:outer membrane protein assembly factor BamB
MLNNVLACLLILLSVTVAWGQTSKYDAAIEVQKLIAKGKVGQLDWPQAGGSSLRNSVSTASGLPTQWDVGSGENILWSARLGSTTYGNPVVANGKVFVGTNNSGGYLKRYPSKVDLGVLLCFDEKDGRFLWQHSSEKLAQGKEYDWPDQGICSTPLVDGDRLWFVTSRGEVACLDTEGFLDHQNDGQSSEVEKANDEADVVWVYDMMKELGVTQRFMSNCSITSVEDLLLVNTSQAVGEAPTLICLNRETGKLLWSDNTPSPNVLHGQWSSPAYAVLGGVGQVLLAGGDGWLYSFDLKGENGQGKLLWKFDCNPKGSKYVEGGSGDRNQIIANPTIYDGLVYIAVGDDPEFGEAQGHLWCIDPTKRGDVSPTLVYNKAMPDQPIAPKRMQAMVEADGDFEKPNPNSAAVWHYVGQDTKQFEQTMHRACGGVTIKNDLLFISDFSGLLHCLDAKSGKPHWTHDLFAASWSSPLIAGNSVYVTDEDGDVAIFELSPKMKLIGELNMEGAVLTTPSAANNKLFISSRSKLFAIGTQSNDK